MGRSLGWIKVINHSTRERGGERESERETPTEVTTQSVIYICPFIQSVMGNALGVYVTRTTAIALREECANVEREKLVFFFFLGILQRYFVCVVCGCMKRKVKSERS